MDGRHDRWLMQLTGLPTAPGCEHRVVDWVLKWARRRPSVTTKRDRYGNLLLRRRGGRTPGRGLVCFAAHMDHPAFVATGLIGDRLIEADFRGGVNDRFFVGSSVLLHHEHHRPQRGTIDTLDGSSTDKRVTIRFGRKPVMPVANRVLTWDTGPPRIRNGRLLAPACDNLAGVAAALAALDGLGTNTPNVAVLLTRAEEVGFVGAIGACSSGIIPHNARLVVLECSKCLDHAPIGAGPILRVGDRTSTFDPTLTEQLGRVADQTATKHRSFQWQRHLMPGGTCEATAYQAYGHTAACLCLPLGHYHNMNEHTHTIDAETIGLDDYRGLVRWLVAVGQKLDAQATQAPLRQRLDRLFARRKSLLNPSRPVI